MLDLHVFDDCFDNKVSTGHCAGQVDGRRQATQRLVNELGLASLIIFQLFLCNAMQILRNASL